MQSQRVYCLFALLAVAGCSAPNSYQPPPPPEVTFQNPVARSVQEVVEFTGSTEASERVDLRARVKGFLESYDYTEGEKVEAGKTLFVIDPKPFQAEVDAGEAALALAQAELEVSKSGIVQAQSQAANADAQLRRAQEAARGGAVTEAELDNLKTERAVAVADYNSAVARVKSAEAQVQVAEANLAQQRLDLSYTVVTAPVSGRVDRRQVDVGNLVGAGEATLLAQIVTSDPIHVYFTVTEREFLQHLRDKQQADDQRTLKEQDIEVRVGLEGEEGFPHIGLLDFAALEIEKTTGTYSLRAEFKNPDNLIPSGAFARVQVPGDEFPALLVPDAAIGRSPSGTYVIVVDKDDKCQRRAVKLGQLEGAMRVIAEGLAADDRVVVEGLQQATPGRKVRPVELKAEAPVEPQAEEAQP